MNELDLTIEQVLDRFPDAVHVCVFINLHRIELSPGGPYIFGRSRQRAWLHALKFVENNP